MRPQATVVVPTRDRRRSLSQALRSALHQRDIDLEVIVVDDGSTDGTEALVQGIGSPLTRVLRNETSKGVSVARNRGIAEARGQWIAFLDDDDIWAPEKLRRQLAALSVTGRRWAYGGELIVDAELHVVGGSPPPPPEQLLSELERYDAVPGGASNVIVAAELLAQVGPFDPHLTTSEDWDMWLRLARAGPPACVPEPVVAVRLGPGKSLTMPRMLEELRVIARRHGIRVDWARHYRWAAWESMLDGRRLDAVRYYLAAIGVGDPRSLGRATVALLAPGYAARRLRRRSGADGWTEQGEVWLRSTMDGLA